MFKVWHLLVIVVVASVCIYASNHFQPYANIVG